MDAIDVYSAGVEMWRLFIDEITRTLRQHVSQIYKFLKLDKLFTHDELYFVRGGPRSSNPTRIRQRIARIGDVMFSRIQGAVSSSHDSGENDVRSACVFLNMIRYVCILDHSLSMEMTTHFRISYPKVFCTLNLITEGLLAAAHDSLLESDVLAW